MQYVKAILTLNVEGSLLGIATEPCELIFLSTANWIFPILSNCSHIQNIQTKTKNQETHHKAQIT